MQCNTKFLEIITNIVFESKTDTKDKKELHFKSQLLVVTKIIINRELSYIKKNKVFTKCSWTNQIVWKFDNFIKECRLNATDQVLSPCEKLKKCGLKLVASGAVYLYFLVKLTLVNKRDRLYSEQGHLQTASVRKMDTQHSFHFADYIVFAAAIVISIGIGIYYAFSGGKQRTTSEFLVGNRQMSVLPVAISLMVSFESSIMMLGIPAEIYMFGIQWFWGNIGFFISNLLSIKIMVPLIHPLPITSAYEFSHSRTGKSIT
ncbi:hypothetical protein KUTeg_012306 [Tegillarca granosa]|uniref:Uncharacterized protein n=1 Tax=Tegillarca granosa TaxID=220873 RepID=A0ABQ9F1K2_TEGGR|nr:hypothetical protein KUTeg_012306 [Tegillarca granosa]